MCENKDRLLHIPDRLHLSEMLAEVTNRTGTTLKNYTVRKELTTIKAITYTKEPIRELDDEKTTYIVV